MLVNAIKVPESYLHISIAKQQMYLISARECVAKFSVSTAKNGAGQAMGSECTPIGWHKIRAKIGAGQPLNSVFIGRRPTGETYHQELAKKQPERDWILSRILWLAGEEPYKNRYGKVDSTWRYIYIHGCPDELMLGKPESHGCIRMKNTDVVELFNQVDIGLKVLIEDDSNL